MPGLLPEIDPDGLLEYSVVFTDRSLNHMSQKFQTAMNDISASLKEVYSASAVAIIPGGGTFAMEAVARQFAGDKKCLVVRNGWFSFRWTQILEAGNIASSVTVMMAKRTSDEKQSPFAPAPINEVTARISDEKPDVVFAPHVETSSGIMLPDDYMLALAKAAHDVGALFVLDCIASGAVWVNMEKIGVDVLISAPQKGWSSSPAAGLVMLSDNAIKKTNETTSSSFSCDLKKWLQIMAAYESGAHAYHATLPTDALLKFRDTILETKEYGFEKTREEQLELGRRVRELLTDKGFKSVAAKGFEAPGVVVSYTDEPDIQNGKRFAAEGMQIAAGVPLQCDEGEGWSTFRLGLFGLDKLHNVDRTVAKLEDAMNNVLAKINTR